MNLAVTGPVGTSAPLATLEQQIVQRTWGRVRQLRVERVDGRIVVRGSTPSYYVKQLVLEAIRELRSATPSEPVHMNITVGTKLPSVRRPPQAARPVAVR